MRERTITVDINKNYHKSLNYKQYDNNNVLNIIIKEDDNLVDITNYTARAFYQLPSKTVIQRNTTKNGKNIIKLKIDKVILAESGRISLEVVINNVDTVVTTFTLFIDVEKSINRNEAIEGNPEWDIISDGLSGLDDVTNRMSIAENEIVDIESEVSTVKNRVSTVEGEVADIESEVIDARDGETSLKARLDRDIEKAKQVYVNVEGSHISTDSSSGYAKDVEILGNTIQDASNLADIRSVGDTVEGQELYEIPVLSCGKNLYDESKMVVGMLAQATGEIDFSLKTFLSCEHYIKAKPSTTYVANKPNTINVMFYYDKDKKYIGNEAKQYSFTTPSNCEFMRFRIDSTILPKEFQLEEGTAATPYEPYVEDKLTILSPTPLEKVGNVADRIVCKDGVWGVEKNINTKILDKEGFTSVEHTLANGIKTVRYVKRISDAKVSGKIISSKYMYDSFCTRDKSIWIHHLESVLWFVDTDMSNLNDFTILVKYQLAESQFIPLPHDQQIKLRTFANKTNISFDTEIQPTLKAQVPKSLGATVNTHTTQIDNLNKELDRVKKLEESTVSTVETESDFTTVEATSNGYFEDVKLEGKTLVNLCGGNFSKTGTSVSSDITNIAECREAQITSEGSCVLYKNALIKSNTTYTIIADVKMSTMVRFSFGHNSNYNINGVHLANKSTTNYTRYMATITSGEEECSLIVIGFHGALPVGTVLGVKNLVVLEGDHTQNPPEYFEGLKSVGQSATTSEDGVDEVSVESMEENIVKYTNKTIKSDGYACDFESISSNDVYYHNLSDKKLKLHIKKNNTYVKYIIIPPKTSIQCELSDGNVTYAVTLNTDLGWGIQEYDIDRIFAITRNGLVDKKPLLYYNNETQTWEKPILREWDSIEKHADGKYYYHQRSGEVVLNGSESWACESPMANTIYGICVINNVKNFSEIRCDKFKGYNYSIYGDDIEGVYTGENRVKLKISNSKLSTQDVVGFKQWLQANPTTVVYQLANEEVFECTNIDLITYANETNYVVNCGAIVPKTTLKVMSNISNIVRELQIKVSTLEQNESKFMQILTDLINK